MSTVPAHSEHLPPTELAPGPIGEGPEHIEPAPDRGLGKTAAVGFLLMAGQSILTRVLTFGTQIVLARLLTQEQFGLFGLAMSIANYATLSQQVGVREILISRQKRFELWATPGFWVSAATGVVSMLLIFGAAPIAGWIYADHQLVWMLVILGMAQPTYNMTMVQEAKLQINLRFKYIALCQFVWGAASPILQLAMALCRFGAFAFVLPRLIAGLLRWWMFHRAEPIRVDRNWRVRRWKYILVPGLMILATGLAYTVGPTVPSLMLGRWVNKEATGYFTFAYNLSLQVLLLLSMQIDSVLFPTLGRMQGEPERQRVAMLRSSRALTAVMAPVCLLPIAAAKPLVLLMFGSKWEPSVEPLQIMSIGMLGAGGFVSAQSLLQAQGRFRDKLVVALKWALISAITSVLCIIQVSAPDAVSAAAIGLGVGYFGYGFENYVRATRPIGGGYRDAIKVILMPCVVGGLATATAWWAAMYAPTLPRMWMTRLGQLAIVGVAGMATYLVLLRVLSPAVWEDLMSVARPIGRRLGRIVPGGLGKERAT